MLLHPTGLPLLCAHRVILHFLPHSEDFCASRSLTARADLIPSSALSISHRRKNCAVCILPRISAIFTTPRRSKRYMRSLRTSLCADATVCSSGSICIILNRCRTQAHSRLQSVCTISSATPTVSASAARLQ